MIKQRRWEMHEQSILKREPFLKWLGIFIGTVIVLLLYSKFTLLPAVKSSSCAIDWLGLFFSIFLLPFILVLFCGSIYKMISMLVCNKQRRW